MKIKRYYKTGKKRDKKLTLTPKKYIDKDLITLRITQGTQSVELTVTDLKRIKSALEQFEGEYEFCDPPRAGKYKFVRDSDGVLIGRKTVYRTAEELKPKRANNEVNNRY